MKIVALLTLILMKLGIFAQGYEIKLEFKDIKDSTILMVYYFAENQFIADSAKIDAKGKAVFKNSKALPQGLYSFIFSQKSMDFIMPENQKFSLKLSYEFPIQTVEFKNSNVNTNFINYQLSVGNEIVLQQEYLEKLKNKSLSADSTQFYQNKLDESAKRAEEMWQVVAQKNADNFLSSLLRAFNQPAGQNFGNINFNDARLLYTPVIYRSLQSLLVRNVNNVKPPHIITAEIDSFLNKAQASDEIFKYSFNYLLDFFYKYQKTGLNKVFYHLAYQYALSPKVNWLPYEAKDIIKKTADEWTSADIGKIAPNLSMLTIDGDSAHLYDITEKLTLLLFWKTGCGHCTTAIKDLKKFYDQTDNLDVAIWAVFTKEDKNDWEKFLVEQDVRNLWTNIYDPLDKNNYHSKYYVTSTPILFLLDSEKKVLSEWNGEAEIKELIEKLESQRSKLQKTNK